MTQLTSELNTVRIELNERLNQYLPVPTDLTARVTQAMRYSVLSDGKALRPFFVLTVGRILGIDEHNLWPIACAIEMVHTYSLIHDDLPAMDNDTLRRGKPTNHIQFDEATAILAGDALLTKAFEVLANPDWEIEASIKCRLIQMLARAAGATGMIGGQMIDLIGEKQRLSEEQVRQMQSLKTGELLRFSCLAPYELSPCDEKVRNALTDYANNIGLLFQITDDLLDAEGETAIVGKTLRKDQNADKTTFISLFGIENTRIMARELSQNAIHNAAILGENAIILQEMAQLILTRKK